jgi:FixJ family two-component response regulator
LKSREKQTKGHEPALVVIDDDALFRKSITRLLEEHGHRVKAYESLDHLTLEKDIPQVGCAILDLNLPGRNGLEIQDRLAGLAPSLSAVFLTGFGRVDSSVLAMKRGAVDFLEKPVDDAVLLRAVEHAIDRSRKLNQEREEREEIRHRFERLSAREREVFALITSGLLNKQAAAELRITEKTIKFHRAHIMQKMEAESLAELAKMAARIDSTPANAQPPAGTFGLENPGTSVRKP